VIIKKVKKQDSQDVFKWRNDKVSIYFSKKKKRLSLINHNKWFNKNLDKQKIKFFMGFIKKKKVGIVRFDIKKNRYAKVSINLNPKMRNRHLSKVLLGIAIKKFIKFKKIKLFAEIKKNNFRSISCFIKNSFYYFKTKDKFNYYIRN